MGVPRLELRAYRGYRYGRLRAYISELRLRTYVSYSKQYFGCDYYFSYRLATSAGAVQCLILVPWQLFQSLWSPQEFADSHFLTLGCNLVPGIEQSSCSSSMNDDTICSSASCIQNKPSWSLWLITNGNPTINEGKILQTRLAVLRLVRTSTDVLTDTNVPQLRLRAYLGYGFGHTSATATGVLQLRLRGTHGRTTLTFLLHILYTHTQNAYFQSVLGVRMHHMWAARKYNDPVTAKHTHMLTLPCKQFLQLQTHAKY